MYSSNRCVGAPYFIRASHSWMRYVCRAKYCAMCIVILFDSSNLVLLRRLRAAMAFPLRVRLPRPGLCVFCCSACSLSRWETCSPSPETRGDARFAELPMSFERDGEELSRCSRPNQPLLGVDAPDSGGECAGVDPALRSLL